MHGNRGRQHFITKEERKHPKDISIEVLMDGTALTDHEDVNAEFLHYIEWLESIQEKYEERERERERVHQNVGNAIVF